MGYRSNPRIRKGINLEGDIGNLRADSGPVFERAMRLERRRQKMARAQAEQWNEDIPLHDPDDEEVLFVKRLGQYNYE